MARKSRKNTIEKIEQKSKMYRAAAYMRLFVVKENIPSDSIENQLRTIEDFVLLQDDIQLEDYYININASGTNFNCYEFQRVLQSITDGKINCVIVKDLSRFGREHIDVGFYPEKYFPVKGVRFISINENRDSVDGVTNKDNLKMSGTPILLTNWMNEFYARDTSRKIKSVFKAKGMRWQAQQVKCHTATFGQIYKNKKSIEIIILYTFKNSDLGWEPILYKI